MNCLEFHRHCLADPDSRDPEFLRHRESCPACARLAARTDALDRDLARAMRVPVPDGLEGRIRLAQTTRRRRVNARYSWLAMAASVLLMVSGMRFGYYYMQLAPLDRAVLHEAAEHANMYTPSGLMTVAAIETQFRKARMQLRGPLKIYAAEYCTIHGVDALHLVLETDHGLVTVLIMPNNAVTAPMHVAGGGLSGMIEPAARGSVAVIGAPPTEVAELTQQVEKAVVVL